MGLFLGVCYEGTFIPKGTVCLQNMRVINSKLGLLKGDALLTRSVVWTSVVRSRGWTTGKVIGQITYIKRCVLRDM